MTALITSVGAAVVSILYALCLFCTRLLRLRLLCTRLLRVSRRRPPHRVGCRVPQAEMEPKLTEPKLTEHPERPDRAKAAYLRLQKMNVRELPAGPPVILVMMVANDVVVPASDGPAEAETGDADTRQPEQSTGSSRPSNRRPHAPCVSNRF